jgi:hypothetical protein
MPVQSFFEGTRAGEAECTLTLTREVPGSSGSSEGFLQKRRAAVVRTDYEQVPTDNFFQVASGSVNHWHSEYSWRQSKVA